MPLATINGVQIYYELHGKGEPLLLIAGYTCDHLFWSHMLTELTSRFQVIIFDNRGIGQSRDNHQPFSLDDLADDVLALMKYLEIKQVNLLGQSMGGAIAQIIAQKQPESIKNLFILNSAAQFNQRTGQALKSLLNLRRTGVPLDLLIDASLPWFWSSESLANAVMVKNFRENIKNNPHPQSLENQQKQLNAIMTFNAWDGLKKIRNSTLVISASDDIVVPPKESKALADAIPNAEFMMIPKGHSSPLEEASRVNRIIMDFI